MSDSRYREVYAAWKQNPEQFWAQRRQRDHVVQVVGQSF